MHHALQPLTPIKAIRVFLFALITVLFMGAIFAQEQNSESPIYKSEVRSATAEINLAEYNQQNELKPKDIKLQISIINPNDRDALNKTFLEVPYTDFYYNSLSIQRRDELIYWIKVSPLDGSNFKKNHLFSISPNSLETIDLYLSEFDLKKPYQSNRLYSINSSPKFSRRALVFELPDFTEQTDAAYFYIESSKHIDLSINYWQADDYFRIDKKYNSFLSMIYAGFIILIIVNLIFYIGIRNINYLLYVLFIFSSLIVLMTASGKIYEYSIANLFADSGNVVIAMRAACLFLLTIFIQNFTQTKTYVPILFKFTEGVKLIYAVFFGVCLALSPLPQLVPTALLWFSVVISPMLLLLPLFAMQNGNKQARYIIYAALVLFVSLIIQKLFAGDNIYTSQALQIGMVLQAIILSIGLSDGIIDLRKQRDSATKATKQYTLSLEIEKKHSELITRVKEHAKQNPDVNQEKEIVRRFFAQLKPLYRFDKAAIIYQVDANMKIQTDLEKNQILFEGFIHDNLIDITRICHGNAIAELKVNTNSAFMKNSKFIVVPVFMRGHEWSGMLLNIDNSHEFTNTENDALHRYATEMVRSLLTVHTVESIREEVRQDVITEKLNRGAILDELESSIKNAQYTVKPLTIGLLEVNDFSLLSETHGKELGDACLVYVAKQLEKYLPKNSIIGRVGTNEFLVIFPDSSAAKAQALFNQVCHTMDTVKFNEHNIDLTLSVGITECHGPFESPRDMMRRADKGLKISLETEGNGINISE